ncbi:helix-turn-helix domain-containing protein [Paenibacillus sp. USDA918EY]|uniref:helix-turn-helix domain-containing protein n=1 Tax=Paenibacillus sp. USDA918EY TaxID=2689575 RepID=UPI0022A80A84|nr:helix-turn-helix transcriptional regulator [Paenibacillus sp. USDA918EY]
MSIYSRVDRSYISELENGEKAPSLLTITALARALQVKPSVLIEGFRNRRLYHIFTDLKNFLYFLHQIGIRQCNKGLSLCYLFDKAKQEEF